jgi:hypothetical protein
VGTFPQQWGHRLENGKANGHIKSNSTRDGVEKVL